MSSKSPNYSIDIKENIQPKDEKSKENDNNLSIKNPSYIDNTINNNRIVSFNVKSNKYNESDIKSNISKSDENSSKILDSSINNNPILNQLIEFGYNKIYSRRIIQYFHPQDIEEALDYYSKNQGIIQHRFIQDRNTNENICYVCGEKKEIHLSFNTLNNSEDIKSIESLSSINNNNDKKIIVIPFNQMDNNDIDNNKKIKKIIKEDIDKDLDLTNQNICQICSETFISTKENIVPECGHSFCKSCWYDFLSVQIQENKLSFIKCLDYECKEKLSDEFIINLLNNNNKLISIYKRYKLELEIINDPNKKLCPYPNCDSYLELKYEKNKNVTCLNNHTFCFFCLKKPHGKLACDARFDSEIIEFTKNNFVKICPNCGIITEKSSGCNHITCSKCNYQWCWLCNGKYIEGHYNEGKCKGFQFFKPKDEYDIKLAFEGKIELRESQRQFNLNEYENRNGIRYEYMPNDRRIRGNENIQNNISCIGKFGLFAFYIFIFHIFFLLISMTDRFMRKGLVIYFVCVGYLLLEIANFFTMIYLNIIMLIPYLISQGFNNFIYFCSIFYDYTNLTEIFFKFLLLILDIFFGGFFCVLCARRIYFTSENKFVTAISILIAFIYLIIFFYIQFIINLIMFLLSLIFSGFSKTIDKLNNLVDVSTGTTIVRE